MTLIPYDEFWLPKTGHPVLKFIEAGVFMFWCAVFLIIIAIDMWRRH